MPTFPTLSDKNLLDPGVLAGQASQMRTPLDSWKRANSYRCPLGPEPGQAWVLLVREVLNELDKDAYHTLKWIDGRDTLTVGNLSIVKASSMTMAISGDKDAAYLVLLADKRRQMAMSSINTQYNVRIPAPSATAGAGLYYTASLDTGSIWTWQTLVDDIWTNLPSGIRGTAPTLPYSPDGTPDSWRFVGVSAWEALHAVLGKIGCTTSYNPLTGVFSYVQLGTTQIGLATKIGAKTDRLSYDYAPIANYRLGNMPETVRVFFPRFDTYRGTEQDTPDANNWELTPTASKDYATGITGAETGSVAVLWDDLRAEYNTSGSNSNSAALQTRADELGENLANRIDVTEDPTRQTYNGLILTILPGSEVSEVIWRDYGDERGLLTEIINKRTKVAEKPTSGVITTDWPQQSGRCEGLPENLKTIDLARNQYPLYPRESQLVQVDDGASATGAELTANGDGLFAGFVYRWADGSYGALDGCWIRPADLEGTSESAVAKLKQKDRLTGRLYGVETSGGTTLPIYIGRKGSGTTTASTVMWGIAKTNWTDNGASCDHLVVHPCDDCEGSNPDTGTDINVLLPKAAEQDPNVVTGDVIAYSATDDASNVAVSDYLDEKIGTVKMWALASGDVQPGWAVMNGSDNGAPDGSGFDLTDRFVRPAASSGGQGGEENHTHVFELEILPHTTEEIAISLDHTHNIDIFPHQVLDLKHKHPIAEDTISFGWDSTGVNDQKPHWDCTEDPVDTTTSPGDCVSDEWGPLSHYAEIEMAYGGGVIQGDDLYHNYNWKMETSPHDPLYTEMIFIERIDNSV
jgi:hypothetical protein